LLLPAPAPLLRFSGSNCMRPCLADAAAAAAGGPAFAGGDTCCCELGWLLVAGGCCNGVEAIVAVF
jgi:hypothetical protein